MVPSVTMGELMALRNYRNYADKEDYLQVIQNIQKNFSEKTKEECNNKNLQMSGRIFEGIKI